MHIDLDGHEKKLAHLQDGNPLHAMRLVRPPPSRRDVK
jgi:hypothetical protein